MYFQLCYALFIETTPEIIYSYVIVYTKSNSYFKDDSKHKSLYVH